MSADVAVAIVGAGPVGLAAAVDLGWLGVDCVVIEQGDGTVGDAKFVDINMRTMEYCRRWGVADEIRERGFAADYPQDVIIVTSLTGYLLGRQRFPAFNELRTPPVTAERIGRCPQTIFDPILRRVAASYLHVRLRYRHALRPGHAGCLRRYARAHRRRNRKARRAARRLSHLRPRRRLDDPRGTRDRRGRRGDALHNANVVFRSPELARMHDKGPGFYTAVGPEGRWASILAIDGRELWRLHLTRPIDRDTFDEAEAARLIRRFAGRDFAFEIRSALVWTRREVVAERYQAGRIFLVGDAAHQLSPAGGFGLNTGIGDATNLSWKLAATLAGWGGSELLASYEPERRPIGLRNVRAATRRWAENAAQEPPGPAIDAPTPEGERVRARVREDLQTLLNRMNCGYEYGARYEDVGLQLGYRYEESPIVTPDGTPPPPDDVRVYYPVARPGARAPHFWLRDDTSIIDLFGRGFVLLRLGKHPPSASGFERAAAEAQVPLIVHAFDHPHLFHLYNAPLVLVRPDGHVAWRAGAEPADCRTVLDTARGAGPR